jgi:hypothetical protein
VNDFFDQLYDVAVQEIVSLKPSPQYLWDNERSFLP